MVMMVIMMMTMTMMMVNRIYNTHHPHAWPLEQCGGDCDGDGDDDDHDDDDDNGYGYASQDDGYENNTSYAIVMPLEQC